VAKDATNHAGSTSHPGQLSLAIPSWVGAINNKYESKVGDTLRLGSKDRYGSCVWVADKTVCDPLVTHI